MSFIKFRGPAATEDGEGGQVYRCYDGHGQLLYVGASVDARKRLRQHETDCWYPYVVEVAIEQHPTRRAAFKAKTAALVAERPIKISRTRQEWVTGVIRQRRNPTVARGGQRTEGAATP
jgi:predicted GIY-YIG superfamily endonuclease